MYGYDDHSNHFNAFNARSSRKPSYVMTQNCNFVNLVYVLFDCSATESECVNVRLHYHSRPTVE